MNNETNWETYDYLLGRSSWVNKNQSVQLAVKSFNELTRNNPAFQLGAKRNGARQPMLAVRKEPNVCKVYIRPEDKMYIGDLVEVYGEHWLVMEMYEDEYGLAHGEMWICNELLRFQNSSKIVEIYGIIDDGSYGKNAQKILTTADAQYNLYLPLNNETNKLFIDKRLAVDVMYNKDGKEILQVMKINWIDKLNQNYGMGSHLFKAKLVADTFNPEKDSIEKQICDYIEPEELENEEIENLTVHIEGKETVRIGTEREYSLIVDDGDYNKIGEIEWSVDNEKCFITQKDNGDCLLKIGMHGSLIGSTIKLTATYTIGDETETASKEIKVVTIG